MQHRKIAVVGCGVAGSCVALILARHRHSMPWIRTQMALTMTGMKSVFLGGKVNWFEQDVPTL